MAVTAYAITVSSNGAKAQVVGKGDPIAAADTALTDITAALEDATIAGDNDATTAVELVQTDVTALKAIVTGNIVVLVDHAVVTTKNGFNAAIDALKRQVEGSGSFT